MCPTRSVHVSHDAVEMSLRLEHVVSLTLLLHTFCGYSLLAYTFLLCCVNMLAWYVCLYHTVRCSNVVLLSWSSSPSLQSVVHDLLHGDQ